MHLLNSRGGKTRHLLVIAALTLATFSIAPAIAHDGSHETVMAGPIEIGNAYARATLPGAEVGGGYMTLINTGDADDTLLSVRSPVSSSIQLHRMIEDGDVMRMEHLEDGIVIPAGQAVTLAPGRTHIMFVGLDAPLVEGEDVPVTLVFEQAGEAAVDLEIRGIAAGAAHDSAEH